MTRGEAAEIVSRHQRIAESYRSDIRKTENNISDQSNEKKSLEKRRSDVQEVIRQLLAVNSEVGDANRQAQNTQMKYEKSIHLEEMAAQSIETAYQGKSIEEEANTQNALQKLREEEQRITNAINSIQAEINRLNNVIDSLNHEIRYCENVASDYTRVMNSLPN